MRFTKIIAITALIQPMLISLTPANNPLVENFSIQLSKQLEQSVYKHCEQFTKNLVKEETQDSLGAVNQARFNKIYNNNYPMCVVETIARVKKYFSSVDTKPN